MKQFLSITLWTILLAAAFVGLFVFYLLLFPPYLSTVDNAIVYPTTVKQGETIGMHVGYCKTRSVVTTIIRTVETYDNRNISIPFPPLSSNAPIGCGTFVLDTIIPVDTIPGTYQMDFTVRYQANPLRTINTEVYSNTFKVVAK